MNNSILIAVAIVAAAVIVKLPIGPKPPGRYQIDGSGTTLINTATGETWLWFGTNGWRPATGGRP